MLQKAWWFDQRAKKWCKKRRCLSKKIHHLSKELKNAVNNGIDGVIFMMK